MTRPEIPNGTYKFNWLCPKCKTECACKGVETKLVGMYSPPGHNHDDNCKAGYFKCVCGCRFSVAIRSTCPTPGCDWKGKTECSMCFRYGQVESVWNENT